MTCSTCDGDGYFFVTNAIRPERNEHLYSIATCLNCDAGPKAKRAIKLMSSVKNDIGINPAKSNAAHISFLLTRKQLDILEALNANTE